MTDGNGGGGGGGGGGRAAGTAYLEVRGTLTYGGSSSLLAEGGDGGNGNVGGAGAGGDGKGGGGGGAGSGGAGGVIVVRHLGAKTGTATESAFRGGAGTGAAGGTSAGSVDADSSTGGNGGVAESGYITHHRVGKGTAPAAATSTDHITRIESIAGGPVT